MTASTSSLTVIAPLTPVMSQTNMRTASASEQAQRRYDSVDEFFGYRFATSATHASRHDQTNSVVLDPEVPPPYAAEDSSLPAYTTHAADPITLSMYLFKFGFLFPPFWIFGFFILFSPLREPPISEVSAVWMPEKTQAERQQIIARIRKVELKWAKRCLTALIIFILLAAVGGVAAWSLLVKTQ